MFKPDNFEERLLELLKSQRYLALFQALIVTTNLSGSTLTTMGDKADLIFNGIVALIKDGLLTRDLRDSLLKALNSNNALISIFNYYETNNKINYQKQLIDRLQTEIQHDSEKQGF